MPRIFLSPSTQEYNIYITGSGSEEHFMNLIADAMEPYLLANTIRFSRNTPDMTAASSIRLANSGSYDFYLALHSNGSTNGSEEGTVRGVIAFYYPTSANGRRAADIFVQGLKEIYPLPDKVYARATTTLGEVRQPYMPSVLLELGYHDNAADAMWVQEHIGLIAQTLVQALTEYFGLPYVCLGPSQTGLAVTDSGGPVNLRSYPSAQGQVIVQIPNGSTVTVFGRYRGWYVVLYDDILGYVSAPYVQI